MGKRRIILCIAIVVLAGVLFGSGMMVGAATNGAGSQNDPVVSLSYLDYRLGKLEGGAAGGYSKVVLNKGDSYTPGDGSTFIVYSGNASVIGEEGLINVSEGTLFQKDYSVVLYNQFLATDNTSGIRAESKVVLYVQK